MTQEEAKKWLPLIAAKAEGKCFDWKFKGKWISAGQLPIMVGGGQNSEDFRIRRERKLVPWTGDTAPDMALYRWPMDKWPKVGRLRDSKDCIDFECNAYNFQDLLDRKITYCYALRGDFKPCGTYEEEA